MQKTQKTENRTIQPGKLVITVSAQVKTGATAPAENMVFTQTHTLNFSENSTHNTASRTATLPQLENPVVPVGKHH